jgi:hypothetical protein
MWKGCSAATPASETCNTKDDDCNGKPDDGDPNLMCNNLGPKPPHANYACTAGMCALGPCDPGWAAFPPGPPSDGCKCQIEAGEPNGACGMATAAGSVSDTGGMITLTGTLSSANDVDFWSFDSVDERGLDNSYHVTIHFTAPGQQRVPDGCDPRGRRRQPGGAGDSVTDYDGA